VVGNSLDDRNNIISLSAIDNQGFRLFVRSAPSNVEQDAAFSFYAKCA